MIMERIIYLTDDTYTSMQKPSNIYMVAIHLMAVIIISSMISEENLHRK